jgi:aspergillopepsin I
LWVYSTLLPAADDRGQTEWAPGKSSTAEKLSGYTWKISYGDGSSSSGIVYKDTVTIGGVTYAEQAVEAAEKVSSEFVSDTDSDGLLGLAFSTLNSVSPVAQKTFFDNIKANLAQPLFVADLKHNTGE